MTNGEILEIPSKATEPGSGRVNIPSKPPEPGSERFPSTIVNLNDIDGIDEIVRQTPELGSYKFHSTDNDIETSSGMLYIKISSCLSALIEDYTKTGYGEKYERIQGFESYRDSSSNRTKIARGELFKILRLRVTILLILFKL